MKRLIVLAFLLVAFFTSCKIGLFVHSNFQFYVVLFPNSQSRELVFASLDKDEKRVEELLKKGADINDKGWNDITPLFIPALLRDAEALDLMLRHGADFRAKIQNWKTVIDICMDYESPDLLQVLFKNGMDVNIESNGVRIIERALLGIPKKNFDLIMANNPDLNYATEPIRDPLGDPLVYGTYEDALILLKHGSKSFEREPEFRDYMLRKLKQSAALKTGWNLEDFRLVLAFIHQKYPNIDISDLQKKAAEMTP